jgi:16S rRNA (guanine527-N7)-methyltransferase
VTDPLRRLRRVSAEILGRDLGEHQLRSISKYLDLLVEWNRTQRLVGSDDKGWIIDNIVLDSLLFLKMFPTGATRVLDIGSGAGVPGIPIKIACPELELVMVESRRKRASFLSAVVRTLTLRGARVVNARAEAVSPEEVGLFDVVTARCAGHAGGLLSTADRFLSESGIAVVSGPPERGELPPGCRWVEVLNPLTGRPRGFVVAESHSRRST